MRGLAFSSNAFKKNALGEAIDAIGDAGYRGVELMADLHHAWPLTFDAARRRDTAKQISDLGMTVSNVNAFTCFVEGDTYHPTWIEADPKLRQKRVDHTIRCLEMAQEFGVKTLSIQPGGPLIGTGLNRVEGCERFGATLAQCVPTAKACGVTIAIEPEPGLLIQTAQEYLQFKRQYFAREKSVLMNCDIGHLFCVGDDPVAVIHAMAEQIVHVHLEDIGSNRVHQHLTPGNGVIDFASIFNALRDVGYNDWVTVELYPYEATAGEVAKKAIEHLRTLL
jgi:sugar phosphate isomerase/epimerase